MDNSENGRRLLARRNAERDMRKQVANPTRQKRMLTSAACRRELQPGTAELYRLKTRQARGNIKRAAEEEHAGDRGGKRLQQNYGLQQTVTYSSQPGRGSFGNRFAPGTSGTIVLSPMRQPPPGLSPGSVETPLPLAADGLPALPGTVGVAPGGTGTWDLQTAQTPQPAQQQGPRSGGPPPPNR